MVAYSFQKRFVGHVQAGLEPGPWCPGMKRHTLRAPRLGRQGHARPEQPVHLYTGMRTRQCRLIGRATARVQIPVLLSAQPGQWPLMLLRREGAMPRSKVDGLAPIVRTVMEMPVFGGALAGAVMDDFARADGFASTEEMLAFFDPPRDGHYRIDLVLIGWSPEDR